MSLANLPLELILKIAYNLDKWDDIHCFSCVFRDLRKLMDYAKYARQKFVEERERPKYLKGWAWSSSKKNIQSKIINVGDDRVRMYANPWYDDRVTEKWRCRYSWVDYKARFYEGETTSLTWIFQPYGGNFDGVRYSVGDIHHKYSDPFKIPMHPRNQWLGRLPVRLHLSVVEICAAFRQDRPKDRRVPMSSWLEEKVKRRYDNLYTRMVFKEMGQCAARTSVCRDVDRHYLKRCFPYINVYECVDEDVVRNKRRKMDKKHYFGEIDVRDFLKV